MKSSNRNPGNLLRRVAFILWVAAALPGWAQSPAPPPRAAPGARKNTPKPIDNLRKQAQQAIERKDCATAIDLLKKIVETDPQDAVAWFNLGNCYALTNARDEAAVSFRTAIKVEPELYEAAANLGLLLTQAGRFSEALPYVQQALKRDHHNFSLRLAAGVCLSNLQRDAEAIVQYEAAAAMKPSDLDVLSQLAQAYLKNHDSIQARRILEKIVTLDPNNENARLGLANLALESNDSREAMKHLKTILALHPDNLEAREQVATLLLNQKEFAEAATHLERVLATDPKRRSAAIKLAHAYAELNQPDKAITLYTELLSQDPNNFDLLSNLGKLYLQKKDLAKAQTELRAALALKPRDLETAKNLASVFLLQEQYPAAASLLDQIVRLEGSSPGDHFFLALCYDKMNMVEQAYTHYQKFLELDQGKNDTQDFQARQRMRILEKRRKR